MPRSVSSPRVLSFTLLAVVASLPLACGGGDDNDAGLISISGGGNNSNKGMATVDAGVDATVSTETDAGIDAGVDAAITIDSGLGCSDGVKDNLETDVDCGGTVCAPCADGKKCIEISDCIGMGCTKNICDTPTCTDDVLNEDETDVDCGGSHCPVCTVGRKCAGSGDCSSGSCSSGLCACPAGMVIAPQAELLGGAYCIDQTEVTKGQYNLFLDGNPKTANQVAGCETNGDYVPRGDWPPAATPTNVANGYPVRYVDWCDAYAYCKEQSKELCGNIGGGALPDGLAETDLDRATSGGAMAADGGQLPRDAWYNACSIQGVNLYPYGKAYVAGECDDGTQGAPAGIWADYDPSNNLTNEGCQGGATLLFQMSGNVTEWENACSATTGASDQCAVRGGSYLDATNTPDLSCKWQADQHRSRLPADADDETLADVGFRCCKY